MTTKNIIKMPFAGRTVCYRMIPAHTPEVTGLNRSALNFYATEPANGVNSETVPVLILHGFEGLGFRPYLNSVHESISSKRNFLTITVDYLGTRIMLGESHSQDRIHFDDWALNITNSMHEQLGIGPLPLDQLKKGHFQNNLTAYLKSLPAKWHNPETPLLCLTSEYAEDHQDFGVIQTMDCLWAMAHLKKEYPNIRWDYLSVSGLSHGGYLATQCARFAPHTFALISNGYGYTHASQDDLLKSKYILRNYFGVTTAVFFDHRWSSDSSHVNFLSDDRLRIRNQSDLELIRQWRAQSLESTTHQLFVHHINDQVHPRADKDQLISNLRAAGFTPEYYTSQHEYAQPLKTFVQGEKTSLKGYVFDFITPDRYETNRVIRSDFERREKTVYSCNNSDYIIDFSQDYPVLTIKK